MNIITREAFEATGRTARRADGTTEKHFGYCDCAMCKRPKVDPTRHIERVTMRPLGAGRERLTMRDADLAAAYAAQGFRVKRRGEQGDTPYFRVSEEWRKLRPETVARRIAQVRTAPTLRDAPTPTPTHKPLNVRALYPALAYKPGFGG